VDHNPNYNFTGRTLHAFSRSRLEIDTTFCGMKSEEMCDTTFQFVEVYIVIHFV
jgi:hypothetical protein